MTTNDTDSSNEVCEIYERTSLRCAWPWISGFFAAPAFVHLVRALAGWDVIIGGTSISMRISLGLVLVCGALSILAAIMGCKKKR